jgi:hypothetical protein
MPTRKPCYCLNLYAAMPRGDGCESCCLLLSLPCCLACDTMHWCAASSCLCCACCESLAAANSPYPPDLQPEGAAANSPWANPQELEGVACVKVRRALACSMPEVHRRDGALVKLWKRSNACADCADPVILCKCWCKACSKGFCAGA